jgi:EmrB/QacA subfamily drug resistance transporter
MSLRVQRKPFILTSLLLAAFVVNLDTSIVNVALPTLVRDLHASTSMLQWVVDAYTLVFASLLLAAGSLSDRVGRKGMLLAGLAVFGLASLAGGLTTTSGQLIAARCVMGLGAAMIFPATLSLISNVFTERGERAQAIGLWGASVGAAFALGPLAGGWLLEHFSWASIFFAMAPVAAIAAALIALAVPTSRDPQAPKTDRLGVLLSTAGIGLLTYTIIEAPSQGWGSARTVVGFAVAAGLLGAFIAWQSRAAVPLLDVGLFRNLRFTAASGSVTLVFFALAGFIFMITQYFQFMKGYGPLSTGVRLLPVASSVAVTSVLGTKLAVRYGTKLVVVTGLLLLVGFFTWVSTYSAGTSYLEIAASMVVGGTGTGFTSAPATEAIMGVVPKAKAGVGSAVNDASRLVGATLGVAVIGSVYNSLFSSRLSASLPADVPAPAAQAAHSSIGAALEVAHRTATAGHPAMGAQVQEVASSAFFSGLSGGCLVAAAVSAAGAIIAALLLPAQPLGAETAPDRRPAQPAPAGADWVPK